jgi:hypothetical protein
LPVFYGGCAAESGLFEIQADHLNTVRRGRNSSSRDVVYALFRPADVAAREQLMDHVADGIVSMPDPPPKSVEPNVGHTVEFARCFLRLANLPNYALDRLSRYEATLWRQVRQTLLALDALDRGKPEERGRRFPAGPPVHATFVRAS